MPYYKLLLKLRNCPFSEWRQEGGIIVNNVRMPDPPLPPASTAAGGGGGGASTRQRFGGSFRRGPAVSGPTPLDKRVLVQEEFDKRLKVHFIKNGKITHLPLAH